MNEVLTRNAVDDGAEWRGDEILDIHFIQVGDVFVGSTGLETDLECR